MHTCPTHALHVTHAHSLVAQAKLSQATDMAKHYRLDWVLRQARKPPGLPPGLPPGVKAGVDGALKGLTGVNNLPSKRAEIEVVVKERTRAALGRSQVM